MKFENYFDLLLLHRVLLEAKFSENPNDRDVPASPQVAKISNQIIDEIIDILEKNENKKEANDWRAWRESLKARPREQAVIKLNIEFLKENNTWSSLSLGEQREVIEDLAAPFLLTGDEIDEILLTCNH